MKEDQPRSNAFRIIYATRTHSQIQEFLSEFKKTKYCKIFSALELASRKHYCFNEKVNKLENNYLMKEKCREQRSSKEGCPYYTFSKIYNSKFELFPIKAKEEKVDLVGLKLENTLGKNLVDIEDIASHFKQKKLCPYYCTKENSKFADVNPFHKILAVPYATLLSEEARESLGIEDLSRSIILFDEAHNIAEAISSQNSISVSASELEEAS